MTPLRSALPSRPRWAQRGGALVEFALLLTLLISLVAGIVEFGRAFWYYDALSKATRNGARALSASAKGTIGTVGAVQARDSVLADVASAGVPGLGAANVKVECLAANFSGGACADGSAPAAVRVSIVAYDMKLGTLVPFLLGSAQTFDVALAPSTTMPYMK